MNAVIKKYGLAALIAALLAIAALLWLFAARHDAGKPPSHGVYVMERDSHAWVTLTKPANEM